VIERFYHLDELSFSKIMINKTFFLLPLLIFTAQLAGQSLSFNNPIAERRADPWVHRTDDGTYYLIATVPEYDRIVIRKANTINGLKTAEEKVVWTKHDAGVMGAHIWAPELHYIDGSWYIYFAAGDVDDIWNIRMWVLSSSSKDPLTGEWKEEGQIKTQRNSFSLDATTFEHKGKRYLIWAQNVFDSEHGTGLVLSEMETPTTLKGPEVILTRPEFSWERRKYNVNEGPAVIIRNGKIFVAYSASATNHFYCMGLLWIDEHADLLDASNWQKSPGPVFYTNEKVSRFGPGHSSFAVAEDGKTDVLIYHSRNYEEIEGFELADGNRATNARVFKWTASGFPDFMQYVKD
jgi:GH43 family beta-xylosidase